MTCGCVALSIFVALVAAAVKQPVTVLNHIAGTTQITPGLSSYKTTGELIEGSNVTACFSGAAAAVPGQCAVVGVTCGWKVICAT